MKELYYLYNDGHNPFPTMKGKGLSEEEEAEVNEHLRGLGGYNNYDKAVMMDEMIHYYEGRPDIQEYIKGALDPIAHRHGIEYNIGDDYRDLFNERYKDYHELVGDKYDDDEELDEMSMRKKLNIEHKSIKRKADEKLQKRQELEERVRRAKEEQQLDPVEVETIVTSSALGTVLKAVSKKEFVKSFGSMFPDKEQAKKAESQINDYTKFETALITKGNKAKSMDNMNAFEVKMLRMFTIIDNSLINGRPLKKDEIPFDYKIKYAVDSFEGVIPKQYVDVFQGMMHLLNVSNETSKIIRQTVVSELIKDKAKEASLLQKKEEELRLKEAKEQTSKAKQNIKMKESEEQRRIDKEKAKAQKVKQPVSEGTKPPKESPEEIQRKEEARKRTKEGIERSKAEKELTKAQEFERNKALYSKNALIEDANREYAKRIPEGSPVVVGGHGFELFLATTGKSILGNKVTMTEDLKAIPEAERGKCIVDLVLPDRVVECKNFYNEDMDEDGYVAIQQSKLIGNDSYAIYFNRLGADSYEVSVITCNGTPVIKSKGYDVVLNAKGGIYHYNLLSDRTHINDKTMIPFNSSLGKLYMVDVGALPKTTDKVSGSEEYIPSIRIPKKAFDKYR